MKQELSSLVIVGLLFTAQARAEGTSYTISMPILKYATGSEKVKPKVGTDTDDDITNLATSDMADAYLSVTMDKVYVYFYPFSAGGSISAGYQLTDSLEVGVDFGLNSSMKGDDKDGSTLFGGYGFFSVPIAKDTLELFGVIDRTSKSEERTSSAVPPVTTKTDSSNLALKFGVNYVHPCTPKVSYVAGANFQIDNGSGSVKVGGVSGDFDTSGTKLTLTLASVRMTFD